MKFSWWQKVAYFGAVVTVVVACIVFIFDFSLQPPTSLPPSSTGRMRWCETKGYNNSTSSWSEKRGCEHHHPRANEKNPTTSNGPYTPYHFPPLPHPPDEEEECPCYTSNPNDRCCDGWFMRLHKHGTMLTEALFQKKHSEILLPPRALDAKAVDVVVHSANTTTTAAPYRHVVLVRHMKQAIVSGYLYHRTGHECWLNMYGKPIRGYALNVKTEKYPTVSSSVMDAYSLPPVGNRTLCAFLAEEAEEDGMLVYIDVALNTYYKYVLSYWEAVQRNKKNNRTLLVCFEDLGSIDRSIQEATARRILAWFYPYHQDEGNRYKLPSNIRQAKDHATNNRDPEQRERLLALVDRLDKDVFHEQLQTFVDTFGCGV